MKVRVSESDEKQDWMRPSMVSGVCIKVISYETLMVATSCALNIWYFIAILEWWVIREICYVQDFQRLYLLWQHQKNLAGILAVAVIATPSLMNEGFKWIPVAAAIGVTVSVPVKLFCRQSDWCRYQEGLRFWFIPVLDGSYHEMIKEGWWLSLWKMLFSIM